MCEKGRAIEDECVGGCMGNTFNRHTPSPLAPWRGRGGAVGANVQGVGRLDSGSL